MFTKAPNPACGAESPRQCWIARGARFVSLFSALLALWSAVSVAQPSYHCRISGQISTSCCCASKHESSSETLIKSADCCDLIEAAQASNMTVLPDDSRELAATSVVETVAALAEPRVPEEPHDHYAWLPWPHPLGPPRFIANCSLLI